MVGSQKIVLIAIGRSLSKKFWGMPLAICFNMWYQCLKVIFHCSRKVKDVVCGIEMLPLSCDECFFVFRLALMA